MKILLLSMDDSSTSQMAVSYAREIAPEDAHIIGAGINRTDRINLIAIEVMQEVGLNISRQMIKQIEEIPVFSFDLIITLSTTAAKKYSKYLPGDPFQINWMLKEPEIRQDSSQPVIEMLRKIRDKIIQLVNDFFNNGYYKVIESTKDKINLVLNNLADGIIVHDTSRRISYFNSAAEEITGYQKEDVIGKDCHEVFSGKLCGSRCSFCDAVPDFSTVKYSLQIIRKNGKRVEVAFSVRAIKDKQDKLSGILASFKEKEQPKNAVAEENKVNLFYGIFSRNPRMLEIFDLVKDVARTSVPVLIEGASGTGKELIANAIHQESLRKEESFVPINCGALPESLLESELFGYVKGAFTGAVKDKKGRFELADKGTIFLDEIGDISAAMQVKLLRVLQDGTFERLGDTKTIKTNVRIVSATNKLLKEEIKKGSFREDLYYRLCVMPVSLPSLKERKEDILDLTRSFVAENDLGKNKNMRISPKALRVLQNYSWPGNIRELQNIIQYALIKCKNDNIEVNDLPPHLISESADMSFKSTVYNNRPVNRHNKIDLKAVEFRSPLNLENVKEVLARTDGNKAKSARLLGVGRATLYRFLKKHSDLISK